MPGPWQGWLYGMDADGDTYELINHARTAAYLRGMGLPNGMLLCDVLFDGGCSAYPYDPPCGSSAPAAPSGYPGIVTSSTETGTPLGTANAVASPAGVNVGDLLLAFCTNDGGNQITASTGWTQVGDSTTAAAHALRAFARIADGGANDSLSLSQSSGSSDYCAQIHRINFHAVTNVATDIKSAAATANSVNPNPPNLNAGSTKKWMWLAATAFDRIVSDTITAAPASYTMVGSVLTSGSTTTSSALAVAQRNLETNIEDPGTFTSSASARQWNALTLSIPGSATLPLGGWSAKNYFTPAIDNAPWYNPNEPESANALGFWIEEWTGLDNAHVKRNVQGVGRSGGGGQLGVLGATERVMALNVLLFARTEAAMEHLFRWFEQTLSSVCATCATDSILIRRFCGTTADLWGGVTKLNQVGLVAGPTWETEPLDTGRCFLRRVSFTLAAGDPCMYGTGTASAQDATAANVTACLASLQLGARNPCRPSCPEITAGTSCRSAFFVDVPETSSALTPVMTLSNPATEYTIPVRVIAYADPLGVETAPGVSNPCSLQILGELYVRALKPGATLVWDVASRDVTYRDHTTGSMVPGWGYVDPNDQPQRRWFVLPCGKIVIVIEPATACLEALGGGVYSDGVHRFDVPHYPSLALEIVPRFGCP